MDDTVVIMQEEDMGFTLDMDSKSLLQSMTEVLDQAFESEYFGLSSRKVLKETQSDNVVKKDILDVIIVGDKEKDEDQLEQTGEVEKWFYFPCQQLRW